MFFHQLISGPLLGLAVLLLVLESFNLFDSQVKYRTLMYSLFYLIFFMSVISGLCLDLGLEKYWEVSLLLDLFHHPYGRSSLIGFILINLTFLWHVFFLKKREYKYLRIGTVMLLIFGSLALSFWSFVINSIMQKPDLLISLGMGLNSSEIHVDWIRILGDKYFVSRFFHFFNSSLLQAALLALLLLSRNSQTQIKRKSMLVTMVAIVFFSLCFQVLTGHIQLNEIALNQEAKMSAILGCQNSAEEPVVYIIGASIGGDSKIIGLPLPSVFSQVLIGEMKVRGIDEFKPQNVPDNNRVFNSFHLMIFLWIILCALCFILVYRLRSGKSLYRIALFSWVFSVMATQSGWLLSEMGRQPWLFYGLVKSEPLQIGSDYTYLINNLILQLIIYIVLLVFVFKKYEYESA